MQFIALCFYIISQAYTIPLFAIGPSWAIFPTLPDIAFVVFLLTSIFNSKLWPPLYAPSKTILKILLLLFAVCLLSYSFFVLLLPSFTYSIHSNIRSGAWGLFQLYRLVQFILIYWMTAKIPLNQRRIRILERIVYIVLLFVITFMLIPYLLNIPMKYFVKHLPDNIDIIGPYIFYKVAMGKAWGTIGYLHTYVGLQVMMLLGLMLNLVNNRNHIRNIFVIIITIIAIYASESRTCLVAILIYVIAVSIKRTEYIFLYIIIMAAFILYAVVIEDDIVFKEYTVKRQMTILEAYKSENLSGRVGIWIKRVNYLNEMPMRWIFGSGFGSEANLKKSAHMLVLQIIMEIGIIGLIVYYLLIKKIIQLLLKYEKGFKSILWITIVFIITSITQITFYPAPAFVHSLGFYLCSVAIALRRPLETEHNGKDKTLVQEERRALR